ncbi:hypothetical protein GCM10010441_12320 [Kitasatospora paracochleata]|uniref:DNA (cytosine-5-)-methyltransferase n=1 Tax=Kitasatospora paracochleata TaxID=58354 RepID=A0ABT1ITP4_9ACTN|nr:DNA cytosine methyltransferase [Kitasatospora paracochleata]MCP2308508.1 DNA (cytosine-5)-methyltransferase 1 [Kitasatospora paracochleata]
MHVPALTDLPKIVDLFAGPGGLDMAAHALMIPAVGIEWDDDACKTRHRAGLSTEHDDVRKFGPGSFPSADILAGGPPCQTFTVAGSGAGRRALDQVIGFARRMAAGEDIRAELSELDDERTGLVLEPLRWAIEAIALGRPYQTIVLEQVPAVLPVWAEYRRILEDKGYVANHGVLHTEEFGVPQTRRRAILIARLRDPKASAPVVVELPKPTHQRFHKHNGAPQIAFDSGLATWVTMGDVLNRRAPFEVVSNYGTGGDPKNRGRRTHAEPAFTVTGKISRNRVIDSRIANPSANDYTRFDNSEAGLLQTFPAGYPWAGNAVAQQIGNAIPPRLGVHVLAAALGLGTEDIAAALKRLENWEAPAQPGPVESDVR